ncbi:5'-methylthioadenosine/S-adenosylhomocysteine nucleosidase [Testudinibacter sp. TR-2022]|uniref:5'-methylthioadenosine/S-adenosylhomocysteine nucleosidase n=1 Tax=Testudinibacter sp. TR-2022 TaxID=2585029 RepID=UPI0011186017|nr:5'-methylthioadenosine/S-adenosylhomocysteine nucleosidase [Testudinibacter sp. TR-2022]TNH07465.1 5'-methylthioadenosine/S-adenosylhomocysteine nucleosidase [Pasteurellaceae bacterium Phil11]TNH20296.1 5'-methylthioadenosine/S-adenosylhomocysteine nucleosidase [Testudinibacter sp. TR-2022]TNH24705.1 5'-methylthioadenosine/S-adenosylhomocysteine nucleosidase [Testudinibacter sp. TR-2022]
MKIGIVGAMLQEVEILRNKMSDVTTHQIAGCTLYQGSLHGADVALVQSGIGKTAAAMATTALILLTKPDCVINTGSAGGIAADLAIGDVIVSTETAYHDADVTAFGYAKGQLPGCPATFASNQALIELAQKVVQAQGKSAVNGLICSGDLFCNDQQQIARIKADFPAAVAVEMEAAAIAQVCFSFDLPFVVVRAVSDVADQVSHISFDEFLPLAAQQSSEMVIAMLAELQ